LPASLTLGTPKNGKMTRYSIQRLSDNEWKVHVEQRCREDVNEDGCFMLNSCIKLVEYGKISIRALSDAEQRTKCVQ
jgi:hypothetical protein